MQATRVLKPQLDRLGAHVVLPAAVTNGQRLLFWRLVPIGLVGLRSRYRQHQSLLEAPGEKQLPAFPWLAALSLSSEPGRQAAVKGNAVTERHADFFAPYDHVHTRTQAHAALLPPPLQACCLWLVPASLSSAAASQSCNP